MTDQSNPWISDFHKALEQRDAPAAWSTLDQSSLVNVLEGDLDYYAIRVGEGDIGAGYARLSQAVAEIARKHTPPVNPRYVGPSFSHDEWRKLNAGETTGFTREVRSPTAACGLMTLSDLSREEYEKTMNARYGALYAETFGAAAESAKPSKPVNDFDTASLIAKGTERMLAMRSDPRGIFGSLPGAGDIVAQGDAEEMSRTYWNRAVAPLMNEATEQAAADAFNAMFDAEVFASFPGQRLAGSSAEPETLKMADSFDPSTWGA